MRHYLKVAYLICRVIDNVEDCRSAPAWKDLRFEEIKQLLYRGRHSRSMRSLPVFNPANLQAVARSRRRINRCRCTHHGLRFYRGGCHTGNPGGRVRGGWIGVYAVLGDD